MIKKFDEFNGNSLNEKSSSSTTIEWYDYSEDNLREIYKDYVAEIEADNEVVIVSNILCVAPYTKPKINNGYAHSSKARYVKTAHKIMTSTMMIYYNPQYKRIFFNLGNISAPIKFAPMEGIEIN